MSTRKFKLGPLHLLRVLVFLAPSRLTTKAGWHRSTCVRPSHSSSGPVCADPRVSGDAVLGSGTLASQMNLLRTVYIRDFVIVVSFYLLL